MKFKTRITIANIIITIIAAAIIYYIVLKTINFTPEVLKFISITTVIIVIIALIIQYLGSIKPFSIIADFEKRVSTNKTDDNITKLAFYTAIYFPIYFMTLSAVQWYLASATIFILLYAFEHTQLTTASRVLFAIVSGATIANIFQYFVYQRITDPVVRRIQEHLKDTDIRLNKRIGIVAKVFFSFFLLALLLVIFVRTTSNQLIENTLRTNNITSAKLNLTTHVPKINSILSQQLSPQQTTMELSGIKLGQSGYILIMDNSYKDIFNLSNNPAEVSDLNQLKEKNIYSDPAIRTTLIKLPINNSLYLVGVYPWSNYISTLDKFSESQNWLLLIIVMILALISFFTAFDTYLPIKAIGSVIEKLKNGNFSATTGLFVEDEAGIVANGIRKMTEDIKTTMKTIKFTSGNIMEISSKTANAIDSLKENTFILDKELRTGKDVVASIQNILNQLTESTDGAINSISDAIINSNDLKESIANNKNTFTGITESIDTVLKFNDNLLAKVKEIHKSISENITENSAFQNDRFRLKKTDVKNEETINKIKNIIRLTTDSVTKLGSNLELSKHYRQKIEDVSGKSLNTATILAENVAKIVIDLNKIDLVIDDTNLLAMNSSVISAQAEESGKGFDVISEEITKLANVTQSKILEVRSLTENLVKEKDTIISNIKEKKKFIDVMADKLELIEEEITAITNQVPNIRQIYENISKVINTLSSEIHKLSENAISVKDINHLIKTKLIYIDKGITDTSRYSADIKNTINRFIGKWSDYTESIAPIVSELSTINEPINAISGYIKVIKNKVIEIQSTLDEISTVSKQFNKQLAKLNIKMELEKITASINDEPRRYRII